MKPSCRKGGCPQPPCWNPQRRKQRFVLYQLELDEQNHSVCVQKELAALQKAGYEQPPAAMYRMVGVAKSTARWNRATRRFLKRLFAGCRRELPEGLPRAANGAL